MGAVEIGQAHPPDVLRHFIVGARLDFFYHSAWDRNSDPMLDWSGVTVRSKKRVHNFFSFLEAINELVTRGSS